MLSCILTLTGIRPSAGVLTPAWRSGPPAMLSGFTATRGRAGGVPLMVEKEAGGLLMMDTTRLA
jgi:hypothetical protein